MKNNLKKMMLTTLILSYVQPACGMHDVPQELIQKIFTSIMDTQTSVRWLAQCLTFARVCALWREYVKPDVLKFTKQSIETKTELLYKALELENNKEVIPFLLKSDADMHAGFSVPVEYSSCLGNYCREIITKRDSAWYKAISWGNVATVACFLKHGARVNEIIEKTGYKQTALMIACARDNFALVELLLRHGAMCNLRDSMGFNDRWRSRQDAYDYAQSAEIKKLLADHMDIERRKRDMCGDFDDTTQPEEERFFYIQAVLENGELVLTEDPRESI
jgi:hypothetical protein